MISETPPAAYPSIFEFIGILPGSLTLRLDIRSFRDDCRTGNRRRGRMSWGGW